MSEPFSEDLWSLGDTPRLRVALRIRGDTIDAELLTQLLGVSPTFSAGKGENVRQGEEVAELRTGEWTYRLELLVDTELGSAIEALLAVFPVDSTLWEELTASYTAEVHCDVFLHSDAQSATMDPEVSSALGQRGLALRLEFHVPLRDRNDGAA